MIKSQNSVCIFEFKITKPEEQKIGDEPITASEYPKILQQSHSIYTIPYSKVGVLQTKAFC